MLQGCDNIKYISIRDKLGPKTVLQSFLFCDDNYFGYIKTEV
jgi:hypothetical protein